MISALNCIPRLEGSQMSFWMMELLSSPGGGDITLDLSVVVNDSTQISLHQEITDILTPGN